MTTQQRAALAAAAKACLVTEAPKSAAREERFRQLANPTAVLELLADLEEAERYKLTPEQTLQRKAITYLAHQTDSLLLRPLPLIKEK